MSAAATVLVAAYLDQPFWNLRENDRRALEAEFPGVRWLHEPRWYLDGFGPALAEAEVIFAWHLAEEDFRRAARLRWLHAGSTGIRRFLYPALVESEVVLTSSRSAHAPFMAEQVMAWMLAHVRRLHGLCSAQDDGRWSQDELLRRHPPDSLLGRTLLVAGYGATGRELALRARAFGMRVIAVKRDPGHGTEGADTVAGPEAVDDLLPGADFVVDALPGTDATRGYFDRERLLRLKPGAFFANVGRGSTVDEDALAELLASGRLGGAGLDVFRTEPLPPESPLWEMPTVQISPHVAGVAHPALWTRLLAIFTGNLRRYLDGQPLRNVVDTRRGY